MRRLLAATLIGVAAFDMAGRAAAQTAPVPAAATSPAKKELVQRILRVQQGDIDGFARSLVEQPAARMEQEAALAMQQMQFSQDRFQSTGKQIDAEVRKYVDEALPIVRERATRLASTTLGPALEAKLTEDDLKQLLAWLESPVKAKFEQVSRDFVQQAAREASPLVQPKIVALNGRIRTLLGVPPAGGAPAPAPQPPRPASK